jgi:hypothetical protein
MMRRFARQAYLRSKRKGQSCTATRASVNPTNLVRMGVMPSLAREGVLRKVVLCAITTTLIHRLGGDVSGMSTQSTSYQQEDRLTLWSAKAI